MTACEDKVAYLSEYLARNAATLHTFVHPECHDVTPYPCPESVRGGGEQHWHIGHKHKDAGERCKAEPAVRPRTHFRTHTSPNREPRGAA